VTQKNTLKERERETVSRKDRDMNIKEKVRRIRRH